MIRHPVAGVRALLEPTSAAVVGASPTNPAAKAALENLVGMGFEGRVGAVNPRYHDVLGVPCVPSLRDLDFVPEAIVVSVNRSRVVSVLEDAAAAGTRAAVVFGIGFAEAGPEGAQRQEELKRIARESGMAVLGPNCQGLINFAQPCALYMDTVKSYPPGTAGLIAQSGSVATALINNQRGVRWRYAVSSGNEAVITASVLLSHMVEDEQCRLVCMFLEAIRDPDAFFAACDRALARDLPIVVLKAGQTEASQRAVEAHSGALAVPDRLIDARFARHGVIRVKTLEELLETANALQTRRRPKRGTVATLTASGGQIEMVLDASDGTGVEHPRLSPRGAARIGKILPDFLAATNPLDYWGVDDDEQNYPRLAELLAEEPEVDIVMAVIDQTTTPTGDGRFQLPHDTFVGLAARHDKLFVLLEGVGGASPPDRIETLAEHSVLLLSGFQDGMRALGHLVAYSRRLPRRAATSPGPSAEPATVDLGDRSFSGNRALELLDAHGIPITPTRRVVDADTAALAARELGFPVVAKLADDRVTHKTEQDGVVLGIDDEDAVRAAVERLRAAGHEDVLIQRQLQGVELILGVTHHQSLGTFIVVGLGGIWTEILGEVEIVPAGLRPGEAENLLRGLRGHELLEGARGTRPVDMAALVTVLEALDKLALRLGGQAASIDLNPVIATEAGAWAVDALVVPARSEPSAMNPA